MYHHSHSLYLKEFCMQLQLISNRGKYVSKLEDQVALEGIYM